MSISNSVTKVEDFDFDPEVISAAESDVEQLSAINLKEEYDASSKSLDATQMYLSEIGFSPLLTAEE